MTLLCLASCRNYRDAADDVTVGVVVDVVWVVWTMGLHSVYLCNVKMVDYRCFDGGIAVVMVLMVHQHLHLFG